MAIVSSPENLRRLDHYRDISRRLALAEGLTDAQARALAAEGKAIVWIDGGLHANEVLGAQQLIETVYQLVSGTDEETQRFLRDVIVLAVHANPDGHELVANWYMRERDPSRRTLNGIPRAVPEVRRARQQSRLLHVEPGRDDQHEPRPLQGVVSTDRLRPPPDRSSRNGDVRATLPRSVQLLSGSADSHLDRSDRSGHARALRIGGQAGRHHAKWLDLLDVVERRPADHGVLSQSDRLADRDNRKPDADRCAVHPRATAAERRSAPTRLRLNDGDSGSRSTIR